VAIAESVCPSPSWVYASLGARCGFSKGWQPTGGAPRFNFPRRASPSPSGGADRVAAYLHLQIVSRNAERPAGKGLLHEVTYDRHARADYRLGDLRLMSGNGHDRTALFRQPFEKLAGLLPFVLDGEIAVPDDKA